MIDLPHSGLSVPHTNLRVVSLREAMHSYGVSFTATLVVGQINIGVAENDGRGGPTRFQPGPNNAFKQPDMEAFAAVCRHGGEPVDVGGVLDCLVDEYDLARRLTTAEQLGRTLVRAVVMDRHPVNVVEVDPPATDTQRAALIAQLAEVPVPDGTRWEIWDEHRWIALTTPTP